jgi:transposase
MATLPIPFPQKMGRPRKNVDGRQVIALRARGFSWRAIAKRLRVGLGTAHRSAAAFQKRSKSLIETVGTVPEEE